MRRFALRSSRFLKATWPTILAGALAVLAFAPFYLFPLLFFSLAFVFHRWRRADTPARAAQHGFAFGIGFFGAGIGWMYSTLNVQAQAPAAVALLCTLLLVCYLSLFPAAVGWAQAKLGRGVKRLYLLLIPAAWTLAELLSGWLFTGFPWLTLGNSQAPFSPLVGFAPLVGAHGITGLVLVCAGALAWAWEAKRLLPLLLPAVLGLAGWGATFIPFTRVQGAPVSVALVQGNIDQVSKWDVEKLIHTLDIHTELAERSRARLIVMPETAFPIFLDEVPMSYRQRLLQRARANGGDLLLGVPLHTRDGRQYLNSVISFGVAPTQIYSKSHLVPFGEYIPLKWIFGWLYQFINMPMVDFRAGGFHQAPLSVAGQRVAMNICYEDVFGSELRAPIPSATLMANVSNDAWFGETHAPWQHLQIVQMRAIEAGRWWLRATNTGVTAIVDDRGRVRQRIPQFVPGLLEGQAQGRTGVTPYVRWGDAPIWLLSLAVVLVAFVVALRAPRRHMPTD